MQPVTDLSTIKNIAKVDWTLVTSSQMCIKSGTTSEKTDNGLDFFYKIKDERSKKRISDFYFDITQKANRADRNTLSIDFRIPPSSIRGALRNYAIKRLVNKKYWDAVIFGTDEDAKEKEERSKKLECALKVPGWRLIQNFFGLAVDGSDPVFNKETVKGRIQVISDDIITSSLDHSWRSPIDRAVRESKSGGLHNFMVLKSGTEFKVTLNIINPVQEDLGFIAFWEQAFKLGLLRIGGLTTVGKGKVIVKSTNIFIFSNDLTEFSKVSIKKDSSPDYKVDPIASLFPANTVDWGKSKGECLSQLKNTFNEIEPDIEQSKGREEKNVD